MLDFQLVPFPFRYGVDEGTDPKQVPPGTLLTAENVVWLKSGCLQKRQGTTVLTSSIVGGGSISSASRLFTRGNELCLISSGKVYAYTSSGWIDRGRIPDVGLEWSTSLDTVMGVKHADIAYLSNGQVVQAWISGDPDDLITVGALYYQVVDLATGTRVTAPTKISSGTNQDPYRGVRIVVSGSSYAIIWSNASAGRLYSFVAGTTTNLKTDASTTAPAFDACVIGTNFVVAYALAAGGIRLVSYSFAATPVQQATDVVTSETSVGIESISIDGASGETLYIGYVDVQGNLIRRAMANPTTLAQTVAPATLDTMTDINDGVIGVHRTSSTTASYAWSFYDPNFDPEKAGVLRVVHMTSGGTSYTNSEATSVKLLSRQFSLGGRQYALVSNYTRVNDLELGNHIEGQETMLVDCTVSDTSTSIPPRLVGKVDLLIGGQWIGGFITNAPLVSSTQAILGSPFQSDASSNVGSFRQGVRTVSVTTGASAPKDLWRPVELGPETYIAAGVETAWDGENAQPYGFAHAPYLNMTATAASGSGGNIQTGNYLYNVTAERRSAASVLHRGPVGVAQTVAVTGPTGSVDLIIVPIALSVISLTVGSSLGIVPVYRSEVDGTVLQRITVEPTYVFALNTNTPQIDIIDSHRDSDIGDFQNLAERPVLYTEGGELEDQQPPGFVSHAVYKNRIFGIDGSRTQVWFTKNQASNPSVAPGFNANLRLLFKDKLEAIGVMDERIFFFGKRGIYYVAGNGPAPNGDDADYGEPQQLQTDVGCSNPRGLVSTPMGIMFVAGDDGQSEIHLLTRKMFVEWKGKRVQDLLDAYPNVTSAVLVERKNHVRFSCLAADGLTGIVVVYDYQEDQWSHFRYGNSLPIADAIVCDDVYTFVTTSGVVYQESDATWLDNGAFVTALLETAWIHANGPLGYQSVRNFQIDGTSLTAHGLSVSVGFDGNSSYQQGPRTFAEGLSGVTSPGLQRARVSIDTRRKCGSIRFKITDSAPATLGTGQGAKWSSMGIEVGVKRGFRRLPATQAK